MDCARELAAGVEGVSKEGYGVVGIAFKGGLTTDLNIPTFLGLNGAFQLETGPSGVAGFGVRGPGVLGISHADRGGLFVSKASAYPVPGSSTGKGSLVAQIRLVPHTLNSDADLPKDGQPGDLLVTINVDSRCSLYLCVAAPPLPAIGATWALVQTSVVP
jgi:hypothetical protein